MSRSASWRSAHPCDGHGPRWGIMDGMHSQIAALTAGTWPVVVVETVGLWETKSLRTLLLTPPFLGPSSSMLLHRLAYTAPTRWTTEDLAEQLGVSPSKTVDGLDRLRKFRMITLTLSSDRILVPSHLGPLDERQLDFLPDRFRQLHARLERP